MSALLVKHMARVFLNAYLIGASGSMGKLAK
jgi:hypothetical protein